ncbi:MAG: hypothetical protein CVU39_15010 [Chloroflexi bacterium HGW-Chloroflexi-10]|nr:MAG: hypothetical protein CVU39_15010 [Chloroflexi bacterium HGW-Chloroflexi-10]
MVKVHLTAEPKKQEIIINGPQEKINLIGKDKKSEESNHSIADHAGTLNVEMEEEIAKSKQGRKDAMAKTALGI